MFQRNRKSGFTPMDRRGPSGFTLLELLIVVIIVSILAAVALPRFGKMTKKARSSEAATAVGAFLTGESVYYTEKEFFTSAKTELLVDVDETNFGYAITLLGAGATQEAGVKATGVAGGRYAGITVTGTVRANGTRTDLVTVVP